MFVPSETAVNTKTGSGPLQGVRVTTGSTGLYPALHTGHAAPRGDRHARSDQSTDAAVGPHAPQHVALRWNVRLGAGPRDGTARADATAPHPQ